MNFEKQAIWNQPVIFEKGQKGLRNNQLPELPNELKSYVDRQLDKISKVKRITELKLPEVGELEVLRHYTRLSQMNFGVTTGFYPLGSCTMKYNPIINDKIASSHKIGLTHPDQPVETIQGCLQIIYELQEFITEIFGLPGVTVQPAAGAAGEYTGLLVIRAYHKKNGEDEERREIIIPDSAHGTNFASAAMAGYKVVIIPSTKEGLVDLEALRAAAGSKTAGFMLTNPSTLGIFEYHIKEITSIIHDAGGLCYYDGANLNAIVGISRPGDMLFDVAHTNLHKTFSTPHGGGGPGAGVVAVREDLIPFLPKPLVIKKNDVYLLDYDRPDSIGKVKAYLGNFGVLVRAYVYIFMMGFEGLKAAASHAVLNANYMAHFVEKIKGINIPYKDVKTGLIKHEFVASAEELKKETDISTLDVSKRLLDFNVHPPTIYFPMIVPEALMVEPTETEPIENLDRFINALENISKEAHENPEIIKSAPHNMSVGRVDDVLAARKPKLSQRMK
ncbi:MAG: aminomethyl-transferring glycine dehydrogenase subunit GcvPB [Candidatus Hodarchaeales archaeon]|jgi:glycine dehydrogenase subunit 2